MKILWVINIMLPDIARELGLPFSNREGWLTGIYNRIEKNNEDIEISIAYPVLKPGVMPCTIGNGIQCFPFVEDINHPELYDKGMEGAVKTILENVAPDIVHIFGTEFPHTLAFAKVFNNPARTLIGMQGVCSAISAEYMSLLPKRVRRSVTFRDLIRRDSIAEQQRKFGLRGVHEVMALSLTDNVTGRTFFDEQAARAAKEDIDYYQINETMRDSFYEGAWDIEKSVPHSIFIGQGDYPIKGMHFLIEAVGMLIKEYPDVTIRIAGNSIINHASIKDVIKTPAYGKYLRKLIEKNNLEGHISVLGSLTEEQMKEEYLKCAVFVCASFVENSPNTLAEAMLLGTPVVTSNAGGILDMISKSEGHIFNRGSSQELSDALQDVFHKEDMKDEELTNMCKRCVERARKEFDGNNNYNELINTYRSILSKPINI